MLTASTVQINYEIAESNSRTVAPATMSVAIRLDGTYLFNGKIVDKTEVPARINQELSKLTDKEYKNATLTIIGEKGVLWKNIYEMLEGANLNKIRAIIATKPKKE